MAKSKPPKTYTITPELIPVDACQTRTDNRSLAGDDVSELAESIRAVGLLHPIHVRRVGDAFEILAGVRRWNAFQLNGTAKIPAVIHADADESTAEAIRTIENDQRRDPSALDTARALRRVRNEDGLTYEGDAAQTGIGLSRVKKYLGLWQGSDAVLQAIDKHQLNLKMAYELVCFEKHRGELAARRLLPKVAAGDVSAADVRRARQGTDKPAAKKASRDPWPSLKRRIAKLIAEDPERARHELAEALATLAPEAKA